MMSSRITVFFCATLLISSVFARPRTPQSTRFLPANSAENSVGEFVLWSCTATAQLQMTDVNKNIIRIAPTITDDTPTDNSPVSGPHLPSNPPREGTDDRVNNIQIIKAPYHIRGKPEANGPKKSVTQQNPEKAVDQAIRHKDAVPSLDSPLKTIRVNGFKKDAPILFKEKPQLPQVDHRPLEGDHMDQQSSEITIIKQ